ncbi:MAG: hypothetical protein KDC46_09680 [Thermoleophilia bacterium]|nr:hypothetical protein [Thermoleophilia bacterium]
MTVPAATPPIDRAVNPAAAGDDDLHAVAGGALLLDRAQWRWVRWLLGSTLLACLAIAAFNAAIDPTGKLGTGLLDPISRLARDRAAKVELLDEHPDASLVVLGTSRAKQLDPRDLDADATDPVNAALVGGDLFEDRVLAQWLARRAGDGDGEFPHLVVGVDVEGFRGRSLRGSGLLAVPQVRGIAREAAGSPSWIELAPDANELLLTMDTTRASWRTMRQQLRQRKTVQQRLHAKDQTRSVDDFDEVGMPDDTRAWLDPARSPALARATQSQIEPSIRRYRSNYVEQGAALADDSIDDLDALVAAANAQRDRPLVFITPAHERFAAALDPIGRRDRHAQLVELLQGLQERGEITFVDCSECVPSRDELWLDGAHPSPLGARVLASRLRAVDSGQAAVA